MMAPVFTPAASSDAAVLQSLRPRRGAVPAIRIGSQPRHPAGDGGVAHAVAESWLGIRSWAAWALRIYAAAAAALSVCWASIVSGARRCRRRRSRTSADVGPAGVRMRCCSTSSACIRIGRGRSATPSGIAVQPAEPARLRRHHPGHHPRGGADPRQTLMNLATPAPKRHPSSTRCFRRVLLLKAARWTTSRCRRAIRFAPTPPTARTTCG